MLDRLPLELVQHIVFLTLPSSSSFTKYRERQDTLPKLCLTSRALCAVAQPVLFESVNLARDTACNSFLREVEARQSFGERVQSLRLERGAPRYAGDEYDLSGLAQSCPRVGRIVLFQEDVQVAALEAFGQLKHLAISHGTLELSRRFCLPALEELSLMCCRIPRSDLLLPSSLPNLTALHCQCSVIAELPPLHAFYPTITTLSYDLVDYLPRADSPLYRFPRQILDCGAVQDAVQHLFDPIAGPLLVTLRLHPFAGTRSVGYDMPNIPFVEDRVSDLVQAVCQALRNPCALAHLSSVYLPLDFNGYALSGVRDDTSCNFLENLKRLCAARNIELVFEDLPHPHYDSFISPDFVRRCKAAKAKEAADAVGEGAKE